MTVTKRVEAKSMKSAEGIVKQYYYHIVNKRVIRRATRRELGMYEFDVYGNREHHEGYGVTTRKGY